MRRWDIFCRVVDNLGDIGTCWRLARQLSSEHLADVRLWVDHLDSFSRISPLVASDVARQRVESIEVCHWPSDFPVVDVADVVIEAFACELPENYVAAMGQRAVAPAWINLEYLSAEDWVDDCHLLASPYPRLPLIKYFFFPGFTSKTGGLLRERDLLADRAAFDADAEASFWHDLALPPRSEGELSLSLFCYDNLALPELLRCWAAGPVPVRVLAMPGPATEQVAEWFQQSLSVGGAPLHKDSLTVHALPFLPQATYDRLLWACDMNFVRGEDSFVRAQWAQRPFVWQIYPQAEGAQFIKLNAFLRRYLEGFPDSEGVRRCWLAWNGNGDIAAGWREFVANRRQIEQHCKVWACQLDRTADLANNLACFVHGK